MVEARKLGLAVSDDMYEDIEREKVYRKLYTIPECVRMLLSEKLQEERAKRKMAGTLLPAELVKDQTKVKRKR